jgi:hypothetical protein
VATAATVAKQANENINLFIKLYTDKYGQPPTFNRHRLKWAFQDMVKDLGNGEAKRVIEYYFETKKIGHPVDQLLYRYDKLYNILTELDNDVENRAKIRELTKRKVEERKNANSGG